MIRDFWEYCRVEERLSARQAKEYKNVARRLLRSSNGIVSREAVRDYLRGYFEKAPKTYNNQVDALKAFIKRYLNWPELIAGFKHTHVPDNYEEQLPTKAQLRRGFEALDTDQERAIYLLYGTAGLRRSEALELTKEDVRREMRCVKSKHDTRTKKAGVTFYNEECAEYMDKIWNGDESERLFRFKVREFKALWRKASSAAGVRIRPQILRKWHSTMLGELMVPDRYVDIFQGRAPRSVLARHYTGKGLQRLKRIYDRAGLRVLS